MSFNILNIFPDDFKYITIKKSDNTKSLECAKTFYILICGLDAYKDENFIANFYELFIELNENPEYNVNIFRYFEMNDIPIVFPLIKGYLDYEFDDENIQKKFLNFVSRGMNAFFHKNNFSFVYNKLELYFRDQNIFNNLNSFKQFEKIFDVWKLLYNIKKDNYTHLYNDDNFLMYKIHNEENRLIEIF